MAETIVLITGANRGIGRGILELYAAKPKHAIIAANRDINSPTSQELLSLPTAEGTTVQLVQLNATSPIDAAEAAKTLASRGIDHIDILVANAGIAYTWPKLEDVKVDDIQAHFDTNVYGFVRVYQASLPSLKKLVAFAQPPMGSHGRRITPSRPKACSYRTKSGSYNPLTVSSCS